MKNNDDKMKKWVTLFLMVVPLAYTVGMLVIAIVLAIDGHWLAALIFAAIPLLVKWEFDSGDGDEDSCAS